MVNRELAGCGEGMARVRALGRNHMLWSLLLKDLALSENSLPDELKTELINLGLWSMHYSTVSLLKHLPIEPLIEVNRNIADGLLAKKGVDGNADGKLPAALSI